MRVNVNAFIAVILCTVLLGGLWLLKYRTISEDNVWNPGELYGIVGGSSYSTSHVSSERSASSGTALTLPSLRTISHKASSVPYHLMASSPYSPITSSPHSLITSSPISYASSDAQFHSFGGGGSADGVIGGSLRTNAEAVSAPVTLSMPNYAVARSASVVQLEQATQGEPAVVASVSRYTPMGLTFNSMGGLIYQVGANSSLPQVGYAGHSVSTNKKAPGMGGIFDSWLQGLIDTGEGTLNAEDGLYYFGNSALEAAYLEAVANGQLPVGATWEQFMTWFYGQSDKYAFVPIPDGMCFMCLLVLFYVILTTIRKRKFVKTI